MRVLEPVAGHSIGASTMESSAVEDAMAIAGAFREASESDTLRVLDAQSKHSAESSGDGAPVFVPNEENGSFEEMTYFLISSSWLRKAWSQVLQPPPTILPNWVETVGAIDNSDLIEPNNATAGTTNGSYALRKDLQHEQDYCLVGSHTWLLLSQKFGLTYRFQVKVVAHKTSESKLAVDVTNQLINIPASGRFAYERILGSVTSAVPPMANPQGNENDNNSSDMEISERPSSHAIAHDMLSSGQQPVSDESDHGNDHMGSLDSTRVVVWDDRDKDVSNTQPSNENTAPSLYSPIGSKRATESDDFGFGSTDNKKNDTDDYWAMNDNNNMTTITNFTRYQYGSGLGNLGNTCFMNSTLQCLGHTHALQKYFLSGEFRSDLNRKNTLGTGGELAVAFAKLLTEMWIEKFTKTVSKSSVLLTDNNNSTLTQNTGRVVYPRDFKLIVGKHAEQFMGYDQHDSQEFATYLLDALHEDTNKVTQKPYIEKPEQEEGESDEEAAEKAWALHLQRENSKVLENFMGQVKSRVQCCEEGCGRVSTTFDPFMYLSVPIPGTSDKTLEVHYVPFDPAKRIQRLSVTLPKTSNFRDLIVQIRQQAQKLGFDPTLEVEDFVAADVWQHEIYSWYALDDKIDLVRDSDLTYVFGLRPAAEIRALAVQSTTEDQEIEMYSMQESQPKLFKLDLATMTRLNAGDAWLDEFNKYFFNSLGVISAFNPKGTFDQRVKIFQRTKTFLDQCHEKIKELNLPLTTATSVNEETVPTIVQVCKSSASFENLKSVHDLAVVEFCAHKMRGSILNMMKQNKETFPGGVTIGIYLKSSAPNSRPGVLGPPAVMRVTADLAVFGLREELAIRLSRSLRRPDDIRKSQSLSGQATSEVEGARCVDSAQVSEDELDGNLFGPHELLTMRQIPLTYQKLANHRSTSAYDTRTLGGLQNDRSYRSVVDSHSTGLARPDDPEEGKVVAHVVGNHAIVNLDLTSELIDRAFDLKEYNQIDDPALSQTSNVDEARLTRSRKAAHNATTVLDCIEKYCQMEQLEETEMWYCNRCKKHVRAWKQFHLFRAPPVLIVHLKRFHYSASTHRRDKISQLIDFPLEGLDLSEQVKYWSGDDKPVYDCYAVSNHYGGLGGGHYTAYALNDDGVWCYYDDSRVTIDVDEKSIVSDAAYVLYYRRRDVNVDKDFLLNLKTPENLPDETAPVIILPEANQVSHHSSNDDDEKMDVEETGSQATSAMGSMEGIADIVDEYQYDEDADLVHDQDELLRPTTGDYVYGDAELSDNEQDQLPRQ